MRLRLSLLKTLLEGCQPNDSRHCWMVLVPSAMLTGLLDHGDWRTGHWKPITHV